MIALQESAAARRNPVRYAKAAAPLERPKRRAKREGRREQREATREDENNNIYEKGEEEERREERREERKEGLEKPGKLGQTSPGGSKMRPTWSQNGPRGGKDAQKKRKEGREAQKVLSRASWERSGATSFDFGDPLGKVGGHRD